MNLGSLIHWKERSQTPTGRNDVPNPFVTLRHDVERLLDDFFPGFGGRPFSLTSVSVSARP
jgi:hypothetical protein